MQRVSSMFYNLNSESQDREMIKGIYGKIYMIDHITYSNLYDSLFHCAIRLFPPVSWL